MEMLTFYTKTGHIPVCLILILGAISTVRSQNPSMSLIHANTIVDGVNATYTCAVTYTPGDTYSPSNMSWWITHGNTNPQTRINYTGDALVTKTSTRVEGSRTFLMDDLYFINGTVNCEILFSNGEKGSIGGAIQQTIVSGGSCVTKSRCVPFSSCNSGTCTCNDGYTTSSTGLCTAAVAYGAGCTSASQCGTANAVCVVLSTSSTAVCSCPTGRTYNSQQNSCNPIGLGQSCTTLADCISVSHAVCNSVCECDTGYYRNQGVCIQIGLDDSCGSSSDCVFVSNSLCTSGTCQCATNYYSNQGACTPYVLGSSCTTNATCSSVSNSVCSSSACQCSAGYYNNQSDGCTIKASLNESCNIAVSDSCATQYASCQGNSVCSCNNGYSASSGTCVFQSTGSCPSITYTDAELTVSGGSNRPDVKVGSKCYSVDLEQSVTMVCADVKGGSLHYANWTKDGGPVVIGTASYIGSTWTNPSLTVSNAQASHASANYACILCYSSAASSCTTSRSVQLFVNGAAIDSVVIEVSPSATISQGTNLTLTCTVTPTTAASSYAWKKDGVVTSDTSSTITVTAIKDTAGSYECVATNLIGDTETSSAFTVTVNYAPEQIAGTTITYETTLSATSTVTITCNITDAVPSVARYTFYDESNAELQNTSSNTLVVTAAMGYQRYYCTATNSEGTSNILYLNVTQTGSSPSAGESTEDTSISTGALAAIILGIIFLILVIIIIIVCCCLYGVCRQKEKVEPSPEPKPVVKPYIPRTIVSAVSRKDVGISVQPQEAPTYEEPEPRYTTPKYYLKPATNGGPIISVYDNTSNQPKPHQLPALDTQYLYTEDAPKKRRRRKKKRHHRHHEEESSPRRSYYEEPEPEASYAEIREDDNDDLVVIPGKQNYFE